MLNLELCHIDHSVPAVVANAANISDEGMALVIDSGSGLSGGNGVNVKPCSSTANERFFGVSMFERRSPATMPHVFEFTLPTGVGDDTAAADGDTVATLPFTPTDGTIRIFDDGDALQFVHFADSGGGTKRGLILDGKEIKAEATASTGTASTDRWIIDNRESDGSGVAKFGAADALDTHVTAIGNGSKIRVQYSYALSLAQQRALVGTILDSPLSAGAQVTCIRKGIVFTSFYDTSQAYKVGDQIGLGSGGKFTIKTPLTAAGADATGTADSDVDLGTDRATCIHVPSVDNPFLGIELL